MNERGVRNGCRPGISQENYMLIQGQQMEYSLLKRSMELKRGLRHRINQWDCRPVSRRIIDPNKARKLKESLSHNHQNKISVANHAISVAKLQQRRKGLTRQSCCWKDMDPHVIFNYWTMNQLLQKTIWKKLKVNG